MTLMSCKISSVRGIPTKVRGSPTKFTNTAFLILALQKAFTTVFAGVAATLTSFFGIRRYSQCNGTNFMSPVAVEKTHASMTEMMSRTHSKLRDTCLTAYVDWPHRTFWRWRPKSHSNQDQQLGNRLRVETEAILCARPENSTKMLPSLTTCSVSSVSSLLVDRSFHE